MVCKRLQRCKPHDYIPDFLIRLKGEPARHLILETKSWVPLTEVKKAAAMPPRDRPYSVKVINHHGDEVAKVYGVSKNYATRTDCA